MLLLVAWLLVGCANVITPAQAAVTVDLFSGRPDNPTWSLAPDEVADLSSRLDNLSSSQQKHDQPGNLGYRGIHLELLRPGAEAEERWFIYDGLAEREMPEGSRSFADPYRKLERWLLATGRPHVNSELYAAIEAEFNVRLP